MRSQLILLSAFFMAAVYSCKNPEPETYLLPKGFTGRVVILFDQDDGQPKEYDGSFRVYRIPNSGILKTKFSSNTGEYEISEVKFIIEGDSSKIQVPQFILSKDSATSQVQIFKYSNGVLNDGKIKYAEFIVAPYRLRNSFYNVNDNGDYIENDSFWRRVNEEIKLKRD